MSTGMQISGRTGNKIKDVKIVRLEQIYPFPFDTLGEVVQKHKDAEMLWVQEEPKNMGAWSFVKSRIRHLFKKYELEKNLYYVGRRRAAAPATGIAKRHNANQNLIKKLGQKTAEIESFQGSKLLTFQY